MTPLDGIVVLDLSKVLAGPLCGQYLGDLGADVIKVEPVGVGDDTRTWSPKTEGEAAIFLTFNHNKRSLAVDLKSEEGRRIVHDLARKADVVIQGFGSGTAEKLGVDYATLKDLNPQIVYCEVSGYGRTGPLGTRNGYDVMLQAFSGMLASMGQADGPFARASFSPVDLTTGMHATSGILAALMERQKTGKGAYLEVCLLDSAMALMGYLAQIYWHTGQPPQRMGTAHPSLCPYQAFEAADGSLMIGCGNDAQWRRLCTVVGLDPIVDDPRFATNDARVEHFEETVAAVQEAVRTSAVTELLDALIAENVPCAPIHSLDEALAHPQVAERQLITETAHPALGTVRNMGYPVRFEGGERKARRAPPLLGEHSEEVLRMLGYDAAQIARLREDAVIGVAERPTAEAK